MLAYTETTCRQDGDYSSYIPTRTFANGSVNSRTVNIRYITALVFGVCNIACACSLHVPWR